MKYYVLFNVPGSYSEIIDNIDDLPNEYELKFALNEWISNDERLSGVYCSMSVYDNETDTCLVEVWSE